MLVGIKWRAESLAAKELRTPRASDAGRRSERIQEPANVR